MDDSRFDTLVRAFTAARSRREALAPLVGGALGLLIGTDIAAKKKGGKRKKGKKKRGDGPPPTPAVPVCPIERQCPGRCCPEGQVCRANTDCCTENVAERCMSLDVSCGTWEGLCGWPISCGSCPTNQYCQEGSCTCRDVGETCGPSFGGATCCTGRCGPEPRFDSTYYCRRATCTQADGICNDTLDCCTGFCDFGNRCAS